MHVNCFSDQLMDCGWGSKGKTQIEFDVCELLFKQEKNNNIKWEKEMMNGNIECGACLPRIDKQGESRSKPTTVDKHFGYLLLIFHDIFFSFCCYCKVLYCSHLGCNL